MNTKHVGVKAEKLCTIAALAALLFLGACSLLHSGLAYADPATNSDSAVTSISTSASEANEPAKPINKPSGAGWLKDTDGTWYYFASATSKPSTGWLKLGKTWYYLDPESNGAMKVGKFQVGKNFYIADSKGALYQRKWVQIGSNWYYATTYGELKTGWLKDKGKWYWLQADKQGLMAANTWINDGKTNYYMGKSGAMATGWLKDSGTWYYLNQNGLKATGWKKLGGKWYYLDPSQGGAMLVGKYKVSGKSYISDSSGAMYANIWVKLGSSWYFAGTYGDLKTGWLKDKGKWYWLDSSKDGLMVADDMKTINGNLYAFNANGSMKANTQVRLDGNKCGYAVSTGEIVQIGEYDGSKAILKDSSGKILTGWQKFNGVWFYGTPGTGIIHTGWLTTGGNKYYMDSSGAMVTGVRTIDGKKYAFSKSGALIQITGNADLDSRLISLAQSQGSLRACFNWVKNHKHTNLEANSAVMRYANGLYSLTTPWIQTETLRMMDGRGVDCYGFATTFACLAKALGYDAKVRVGHVPSRSMGWASHAWVEIYQNGTTYICDTDLQRSHPGTNFYWFTYGSSPITYKFN